MVELDGGEEAWQQALEVGSCSGHETLLCEVGPATTAEEYLQFVRKEAAQLPSVLVSRESTKVALPEADGPSSSQDGGTGIEGADLGNHHPLEYENLELDAFVSAFADLRSKFRKQAAKNESRRGMKNSNARGNAGADASRSVPPRHLNRDLWFEFCFGSAAAAEGSEGQPKEEAVGVRPLLSVLESVSQPKARWLLQRVVEFV